MAFGNRTGGQWISRPGIVAQGVSASADRDDLFVAARDTSGAGNKVHTVPLESTTAA